MGDWLFQKVQFSTHTIKSCSTKTHIYTTQNVQISFLSLFKTE